MLTKIKKRLEGVEGKRLPDVVYVIAQAADGTEHEMPIGEWYKRRDMRFVRFSRGYDPTQSDIRLLIAAWDEEAREAAQ